MLETVGRHRPGDKIKVVVERNGKERAYSVTLLNKRGGVDVVKKEEITAISLLGAEFEEVTEEELKKIGVQYGVRVKGTGNGKLKDSGIKNGFIITAIDNNPVKSIADIERYLNNKSGGVLIEGVYANGMRAYYAFGL
jgi:S1-C subfamily serine protease